MLQATQSLVPQEWSGTFDLLASPIAWIPAWHTAMINFAWYGGSTPEVLLKRVLVLLPMLLLIAAIWSTMVSLYTLPFRSARGGFLTAMLSAWWDAGRTIWFFWAGMVRVGVVLVGWIKGLVRLTVALLKSAFQSPLNFLDWTSRSYFKPGVPWVAFMGLLIWSVIEALIFTYTLRPTMTEVLAGITGFEPNAALMTPILWFFLFFLILGSFACIQVLGDAMQKRQVGQILQMVLVELSVIFFEVMFLYREMIDALTPWIAQQTNERMQLGLWATLSLAAFGWVGVRGMTWFLFGRFGTPALLAILGRETVKQEAPVGVGREATVDPMRGPIAALKAETEWFRAEARKVFELLSLPVLQLLAAAVNFAVVTITSRPMFSLPFGSLDEVMASSPKAANSRKAKQPKHDPPIQFREEAAR
jgi:hypothetical protein